MEKSSIALMVGVAVLLIGILLLWVKSFRKALCASRAENIVVYISKLVSGVTAVVGVVMGVNLMVDVQPVFKNYVTNTMQAKSSPQLVRDTVVVHSYDTVFIFTSDSGSKRDASFESYARRARREFEDYVKKERKDFARYVRQTESDFKDYLQEDDENFAAFVKGK
jgi:hypothetical protein